MELFKLKEERATLLQPSHNDWKHRFKFLEEHGNERLNYS